MKAYCILQRPRPDNKDLCFTYSHMFLTLSKYVNCSTELETDSTHLFFLDFGPDSNQLDLAIKLKSQGLKTTAMVFDPPGFNYIDWFKENNALDNIVLFDQKFSIEYPEAYISDHFFNQSLFTKQTQFCNNQICTFGRIDQARNLPSGIDRVDVNISSYHELYKKVSNYNGVYVFDSGGDRTWTFTTHYNKAKGVEALMCGRNAYCHDGINTLNYNKYLKSHLLYNNLQDVTFDQCEIFDLNKKVIEELLGVIV
jgi:hypothetical protein